jgi:hypothetical protein
MGDVRRCKSTTGIEVLTDRLGTMNALNVVALSIPHVLFKYDTQGRSVQKLARIHGLAGQTQKIKYRTRFGGHYLP